MTIIHTFDVTLDETHDEDYWHYETYGVISLAGIELWRTPDPVPMHRGDDQAKQWALEAFACHLAEVLRK